MEVRSLITKYNLNTYKKIAGGVGVLTTCGLIVYERYKLNKIFSNLLDTNVLDIDKKRPDYIYIKYHIYREFSEQMKNEEQDLNWINVIVNPFGKWWKTLKHSVAWRLLNISQNGDHNQRLKAVSQLARIDHLKDWDFRHLAQICDARTAVSLARSHCDNRWFLPTFMNGIIKNPKIVLNDLKKMLEHMEPNRCIDYFFQKYFDVREINESDINEFYTHETPLKNEDTELLKECVAFLSHITKDEKICKRILSYGGLQTILEIEKIFEKDNETLSSICKIIANMSLVDESLEHFFVTGWVGILDRWQHHPDVRLQVIAAKALANLDRDDPVYFKYPPNIYALYPLKRKRWNNPALDVVFIHGLLGGVFYTWRQKDRKPSELGIYETFVPTQEDEIINKTKKKSKKTKISDVATKELLETFENANELEKDWEVIYPDCPLKSNENSSRKYSVSGDQWINDDRSEEYTYCWPMDWLPQDYPNVRIIGVDYNSAVSHWSATYAKYCPCEKGQGHISVRSKDLLDKLKKASIGENRAVVWIGHSMGGILCKDILLKALDSVERSAKTLAYNTKGIIFLGTPHRGSGIVRFKQHVRFILSPSIEVKELELGQPKLLEMHNQFIKAIGTKFKNLKIVSIAEGSPTMLTTFKFPLQIVDEDSAFFEHGDFYVLKDDHLSLSKPIFRQSFLYQTLLQVLDDVRKVKLDEIPFEEEENLSIKNKEKRKGWLDYFPSILIRYWRPVET